MSKVPEKTTTDVKDNSKDELATLEGYYREAEKVLMENKDREIAEIEDKYAERIKLAEKHYGEAQRLIEAREKEIAEIVRRYQEEEYNDRKDAAEKRLLSLQNELDRIGDEYEISKLRDVKEPRGEEYETRYKTPVMSFVFGLGKNFEHSYQTKGNIEALYQKELENNDALYKLTTDRIDQEKEVLNNQLTELQNNLDQKLISEQEFADRKREISRKLLEAEQAEKTAFYT